jgi:predicted RecB family nuclease
MRHGSGRHSPAPWCQPLTLELIPYPVRRREYLDSRGRKPSTVEKALSFESNRPLSGGFLPRKGEYRLVRMPLGLALSKGFSGMERRRRGGGGVETHDGPCYHCIHPRQGYLRRGQAWKIVIAGYSHQKLDAAEKACAALMQILEGQLVLSATDLVGHLACEHLTTLELGAAKGEWSRPFHDDPELDLLQKKGLEHERRCLERFEAEGKTIVPLEAGSLMSLNALHEAEARTLETMRSRAQVIYQATLFDGRWRGHPDFLVRVDGSSQLGTWSYEPADAKLARRVEAAALLQLCLYADRLSQLQGVTPERVGVVTGDGSLRWHRLADFSAYYRAVKSALETRLFSAGASATYPNPVDHCRICRWFAECADRRRADDHLCRVANITRTQIKRLTVGGIPNLTALAAASPDAPVTDMVKATFEKLRHQARLQQEQYADGRIRYELIPPDRREPNRGLALLPEPSPGDVFLDIENDVWAGEDGREYLLGIVVENNANQAEYQALWSHSADEEKGSFERFIDFVIDRLCRHPGMHVYHYGSYEEAALKRLASRHGTREDELDQLLRGDVLVDLYAAVRQGVRVSQESYSLKKVERLYMPERQGPVTRPGFAMVEYERWLETADPRILESIAAYNRDDCVSIWMLRSWLEDRRREAESRFGVALGRPAIKDGKPSEEMLHQNEETRARVEALTRDVPAEKAQRTPEQQARWILAHLLEWHRREAKPEWWKYFNLLSKLMEELIASPDALGDMSYVGPVREVKKSVVHRYSHDPEQEHKFKLGDQVVDPATQKGAGVVVGIGRGDDRPQAGQDQQGTAPSRADPGGANPNKFNAGRAAPRRRPRNRGRPRGPWTLPSGARPSPPKVASRAWQNPRRKPPAP